MNVKKEQILHIMKLKNKNKGFVLCWMLLIVGVLGLGKDLLEIWRDSTGNRVLFYNDQFKVSFPV